MAIFDCRCNKTAFVAAAALVLGGLFSAIWVLDRHISQKTSDLINYLEQKYDQPCTIEGLRYVFPFGIRAAAVSNHLRDNRLRFKAKDVTIGINPINYLRRGKTLPEIIDSVEINDLELTFAHHNSQAINLSRYIHSPTLQGHPGKAVSSPRKLLINNLSLIFHPNGEKKKFHYPRLSIITNPHNHALNFELVGHGNERLLAFSDRESGIFSAQAESFRVSLPAAFLGVAVPLDDLFLTAEASMKKDDAGLASLSLSGSVVQEEKGTDMSGIVATGRNALLTFNVRGKTDAHRTEIQNGKVAIGGEEIAVKGYFDHKEKPQTSLCLTFADFSIGKAIDALPTRLFPNLPGLKVKGRLEGAFNLFMDMENPDGLRYGFDGKYEQIQVLSLGAKIDVRALSSYFRHTVRLPGRSGPTFIVGQINPDFVPLGKIPSSLLAAVISAEDGGFFRHRGFSSLHIRDSFVENLKARRVVRGASTISMQLAKNLYLNPERTFSRKLEEAFITIALEQNLSKERIMEIYLNIIEWGDSIYGIGPSARYYFNKLPQDLTPMESAFLASIIAYPHKKWGPDPLNHISDGWRQYLHLLLCRMYERGGVEAVDLYEAGIEESKIVRLAGDKRTNILPEKPAVLDSQ